MKEPMPLIVQGDARNIPLADSSVDLIVTSPPYFAMRSYRDGGQHYDGQIGSEPTPQAYLDALIDCTREWMRVLKPGGSMWVNLGDAYMARQFGYGSTTGGSWAAVHRHTGDDRPNGQVRDDCIGGNGRSRSGSMSKASGIPRKSLMQLPHRYSIRCGDELGLILRQDQVWSKTGGLPESVKDRTRRTHEYLFHLVKQPDYYAATDDIRLPLAEDSTRPTKGGRGRAFNARNSSLYRASQAPYTGPNPLGVVPGSVWEVASQPLDVPDHVAHARCCAGVPRPGCQDFLDHYAAFPMELVRPVILGWSPARVCTECGQGRRPVCSREFVPQPDVSAERNRDHGDIDPSSRWGSSPRGSTTVTITGEECDCPDTTAPTTPGVVLDPFGGTATAPLVAAMNERIGISVDRSWDYCDLIARWRTHDPKERARAAGLDPDQVARIPVVAPGQASLMDLLVGT